MKRLDHPQIAINLELVTSIEKKHYYIKTVFMLDKVSNKTTTTSCLVCNAYSPKDSEPIIIGTYLECWGKMQLILEEACNPIDAFNGEVR